MMEFSDHITTKILIMMIMVGMVMMVYLLLQLRFIFIELNSFREVN